MLMCCRAVGAGRRLPETGQVCVGAEQAGRAVLAAASRGGPRPVQQQPQEEQHHCNEQPARFLHLTFVV